jgi:hypothetical protein
VIREQGLGRLTIHWQTLLMEHCFNHGRDKVSRFLEHIDKNNPSISGKEKVNLLGQALSSKGFRANLRIKEGGEGLKGVRHASFDVKGTKNLYVMDRSIVTCDYSANMELLSRLLNTISESTMLEWVDTEDRCSMPKALYRLQEFCNINAEEMREAETKMQFDLPRHTPMDEEDRKTLEAALIQIRSIKKDHDKLEK